jgi:hypothetical protein
MSSDDVIMRFQILIKNYSTMQYIRAGGGGGLGFEYLILEDFELSIM